MAGLFDLFGGAQNMSVDPTLATDISTNLNLGGEAASVAPGLFDTVSQNMSIDPNLVPKTLDLSNANTFALGANPQSLVGGGTNTGDLSLDNVNAIMAQRAGTGQEGGLWAGLGDYFSKAGLKDYGTLLGGVGGLYQSVKAGQLADEQIRASKDSRQFAKDEQKRKQDFINSYKNASANAAQNSNYYSA